LERLLAKEAGADNKDTIHHILFKKPLLECLSEDYRDLSHGYFRHVADMLQLSADEQLHQQRSKRFPDPCLIVYTYGDDVPAANRITDGEEWIHLCEEFDRKI
jgi:hypothetical protein